MRTANTDCMIVTGRTELIKCITYFLNAYLYATIISYKYYEGSSLFGLYYLSTISSSTFWIWFWSAET